MKQKIQWLLIAYVAFVFLQSLFFKFSGSEETVIIFTTLGEWMKSVGLPEGFANGFAAHGGNIVGSAELIAVILLVIPATRFWGSALGFAVMSGAIFFHLGTPLGVDRAINEAGDTDGGVLFFMACGVWLACAYLAWDNRPQWLLR